MNVTYLHHSGFSVETETKVLLFDYYTESGRKAYFDPAAYPEKDIFVFVSHAHEDHYDRRILDWGNLPNVKYVLSFDVRTMVGFAGEVLHVQPHEEYTFDGITVKTLQSNDEGVAFLVKADGKTIYGTNFSHQGETPGLGAKITESDFQNEFKGKHIYMDGAFKCVEVMKKGQKSMNGAETIDAISGATITSRGVSAMMDDCLKPYDAFLQTLQGSTTK